LLIAVAPGSINEVQEVLRSFGLDVFIEPIGVMTAQAEKVVMVI